MANIKKIKLGSTTYDLCDAAATHKVEGVTGSTVNHFGTCSIAAGTAAKTVSITAGTFSLETGAKVTVKFTNKNTASTPTLNVDSTGAKNIFHNGAQITTGANKALLYGTVDFVYDGTQWQLIGNYVDTDTHNSHTLSSGTKADGTTEIVGASSFGKLTLGTSGVTQGAYGPGASENPASTGTLTVPEITVNDKGIIVDATDRNLTLPSISIPNKSSSDTTDLVYAVSNLIESGVNGHTITPTYSGLPTKAYVDKVATGHVKYLGTATALTGLSTTAGQGDFYRVSTAFTFGSETAHVGDIILATKDNPAQNTTDWDLIHTEIDRNTWTANTTTAAGYVAAPTTSNPNKVWRTDSSGNPAWRDPSTPEAFLTWGGKNFVGGWGPIDAAMIPQFAANRFAFLPASAITSEYSTDGGSTWTATTEGNTRENIFATTGSFYIGNNSATGIDKSNYKCRLTITTSGVVYSTLNKFAIRVSTNGSTGCHVKLESRTKANQDAENNTWVTNVERAELSGWSGWNVINVSGITTHGNTSAQYSQLRFTFGVDSHPSTNQHNGLQILSIMAFGGEGWTTPSTMASNGHLYSYDATKKATFPGDVTVTSGKRFIGNLQGTADTATKVATTYESNSTSKYDILAAPVNSETYDSIYKNSAIWLKPNSEDFAVTTSGKTFKGGPRVIIGSAALSDCVTDGSFNTSHAGTGHLEVTGNLIVGGGSDSYGIYPARNNYSKIGDSNHYWWQIYAAQIFQGGSQVINNIKEDGITGSVSSANTAIITRYGQCGTASLTPAKTVSITAGAFSLTTGARVTVKFTNKNTANTPTLNVNSTGAKNIYHNGARITTGINRGLLYGVCDFVYDGTQWHLVGNYVDTVNSNTTLSGVAYCTTAAATAAKTATMPGFALYSGQRIFLRTTVTNSATSSVTLSVNGTSAKTVKIGTADVTDSNFPAGDYIANYDGTNWVLTRIYLDAKGGESDSVGELDSTFFNSLY